MSVLDLFKDRDAQYYLNRKGGIEAIQVSCEVTVPTVCGPLIPIYSTEDHGRLKKMPVKFYPDGSVKALPLQRKTKISTPIGNMDAELVTFHPGGQLKRVFPLNGKISGYWSETDEYKLSEEITIATPIGPLRVKPIFIQFYPSGSLQCITFWPRERISINTPAGEITIRQGLSFYPTGTLQSCEPASETNVKTPLGIIPVYDPDPLGMSAENNSLRFTEKGNVEGCSSVSCLVKIETETQPLIITPGSKASMCSDTVLSPVPLQFQFEGNHFKIIAGTADRGTFPCGRAEVAPYSPVSKNTMLSCSA